MWLKNTLCFFRLSQSPEEKREECEKCIVHQDETQTPISVDFAFSHRASHDLKQKRRHQGMFFCLLETLTPALPQQIGMAHSQMRFLPAARGEKKKVTHYNYSTWFTKISHLCSPTFPLISFWDLGKVYVLVCVHACVHVFLIHTEVQSCFLSHRPCLHQN